MDNQTKAEPPKSDANELNEDALEEVNGGFFGSLKKTAARARIRVGTLTNPVKNNPPDGKN